MAGAAGLTLWQWLIPIGAAAAITAMYFLKTRRRPVLVPSTLLWRRTIEDHRVNALWQRLRRNILLIVQLLLIAAAAVALRRPTWQGTAPVGGRYVFLIDNSASMSTTDVEPTRLDEAKRRVTALIDQMRSGDSAMLVSFSSGARIEQAFTDNRAQLRRAVEAIGPTNEATSLDEALRICAGPAVRVGRDIDIANPPATNEAEPTPRAKLFVFSDGRFPEVDEPQADGLDLTFVPIGTREAANLAVVGFSVRRNEVGDAVQALAKLRNFTAAVRSVQVELSAEGRIVDARRIEIAPDAQQDVLFTVASGIDGVWDVRLNDADDLPLDDRGWSILAPPAKTRVLLVTAGNRYLTGALNTDEARRWCDVTVHAPDHLATAEYRRAAEAGAWDLMIFDRTAPERSPAAAALYFGTTPPEAQWRFTAQVEAPQVIDSAHAHPLLQNTWLTEVLIADASLVAGPPGTQMLMESERGLLAGIAPRGAYEDAVVGFSVTAADGALATNWPLVDGAGFEQFVLNAVQYFGRSRTATQGARLRPGEALRFRLEGATEETTLTLPDGGTTMLRRAAQGDFAFYATHHAGGYRTPDGPVAAVNLFDADESSVATAEKPALRIGREEIFGESRWETTSRQGWRAFLLAVLAMLCLEWYIYGVRAGL